MNNSFERVVFSIVGKHAGEDIADIFKRKQGDIAAVGKTFWMVSIDREVAQKINELIAEGETQVLFLESSGKARPAVAEDKAAGYIGIDGLKNNFPQELSPVTGNINRSAYAFMLSDITICPPESCKIDTWFFADQFLQEENSSVRFTLGYSTVPCKKLQAPLDGMKSRERKVVGIAKISACVKLF